MKTTLIPLAVLALAMAGCQSPVAVNSQPTSSVPTTEVVKRQDIVGYSFFDGKLVIPDSAQGSAFSPYDTPVVSVSTGMGKYVERGEPIVKLTIPGADSSTSIAKSDARSASSNYANQKSDASQPVIDAKQKLADAQAAEKVARESGIQEDLDAATLARVDAEKELQQAQVQMRQTLQPAKDAVNQTAADLQAVKADAQRGIVRAPISGTVVELEAKAGLMAKSGQRLASIVNFEAARVQGTAPAELKDILVKGSHVIIAMNGPSSDPLDGRVVDITVLPPAAGQKGAGYLAVIAFEKPRSIVQPNMGVKRIGVKSGSAKDVLVVPAGALTMKDGKSFVSVQSGTEWIETAVETGITDGALVEIKSGIKEGAVVRVVPPTQ